MEDAGVPAVATGGLEWNSNIPAVVPPEFIWKEYTNREGNISMTVFSLVLVLVQENQNHK